MTSEILLIFLVTLVTFNPKKWPMVAHHLAKTIHLLHQYQQRLRRFWQTQLDVYQLEENKKKAASADQEYP